MRKREKHFPAGYTFFLIPILLVIYILRIDQSEAFILTIDQSQVLVLPQRGAGHGPGLVQVPLLQGQGHQGAQEGACRVRPNHPRRGETKTSLLLSADTY